MSIEEKPVEANKRPGKKADQEKSVNLEQIILERLRTLSYDKQQEVLDFVEFLQQKKQQKEPLQDVEGLWSDLGFDITEEDVAEVRHEMWKNFPRDITI
jgi:hypothetical protein